MDNKTNIEGLNPSYHNHCFESKNAVERLDIITSLLPLEYSELIENAFTYKRIPKEYLLSSILFTVSTSIGLTFYLNGLGYRNYANCYFTIIGSRGDAKTEAIKIATEPLKKMDDKDYDSFQDELSLTNDLDEKPIRKQVLIQNASIEAAHKIHYENPNSVGIAIDEIFGLIEKMSNPNSRDGVAWRNFFLEGYTNGYIDISRKTTDSFRLKNSFPTLIGGLQKQFVPNLLANGNLESGFIDRLFFTPKLTHNNELTLGSISSSIISDYNTSIENILSYKRQSERQDETQKQFEIEMSPEATQRLFKYTQELIIRQESAVPIAKEYMSKMQISIQKLCIILFMMKHAKKSKFGSLLGADVVLHAIQVNEFYFQNFQDLLLDKANMKNTEPTVDQIIKLAMKNNAPQKAVSEITGLNKGTVSKKWKKLTNTS